ncbi:MAG: nucleoside-diphosphate sugar epimerase/dehydratase, partial [Phycisphaerales bacterium]
MLKQQHQLFVGLLAAVDAVVVVCACFVAWRFRYAVMPHEWWPQSWEQYPKEALALYVVPVMLLALRWFGLYRPRRDRSVFGELLDVGKCCIAGVLVVVSLAVAFESNLLFSSRTGHSWQPITVAGVRLDAGRVQLAALLVVLPIMLGAERLCFRAALRHLRRRGWNLRHVCIIGCGRLGQIVARTLERNSWTGLKVAYFISHQEKTRREVCAGRPVKGGLAELEAILDEHKPDAVYIALPGSRAAMMYEVLGRLERFPLDVRVVPDINPRYVPQSMTVSEL